MPIWLDPSGKTTYGQALCGRCSRKMSLDDLYPDPNVPGLFVCLEDRDVLDPWRLPPRQLEKMSLRFVRPDVPLDNVDTVFYLSTENGFHIITEDGAYILTENSDEPLY